MNVCQQFRVLRLEDTEEINLRGIAEIIKKLWWAQTATDKKPLMIYFPSWWDKKIKERWTKPEIDM